MEFRNLKAQHQALKDDIDAAVLAVMADARYISGPEVRELEEELASYVGVKHCVTCANGTDALQLALMAWGVGEGDAVIVPDFTFFSSGEVVAAVGATPVFVDVLEETFNLNPALIDEAVETAEGQGLVVKAVIAVDLFGLPADYPAIRAACEKHGLLLLEDGAQGFGGSIDGKLACSFGDISTTSFFPAKPLGCYGDGGAVFTDNDEWAALLRSYAVHGKGSMKYDNVRIGMNSRLDTVQAAVLKVKLAAFRGYELDAVNEKACLYDEALEDLPVSIPLIPQGYRSSWAQYTLIVSGEGERDAIKEQLASKGIPTMVYYPTPMHKQTAFEGRCLVAGDGCPATARLCKAVLSLPMSPYLNAEEVRMVADSLREAMGR